MDPSPPGFPAHSGPAPHSASHSAPGAAPGLAALRPFFPLWPLGLMEPASRAGCLARARALGRSDRPDAPALLALARGLARFAWQLAPFDPARSGPLAELDAAAPFLPEDQRRLARLLFAALDRPDPVEGFDDLLASPQHHSVLPHLPALVRDRAQGLFRLGRSWDYLLRLGAAGPVRELAALAPLPPGLRPRLEAEIACFLDPPDRALDALEALPETWDPWRTWLAADRLARLGDRPAAAARLARLWPEWRWHPHLVLVLDELTRPRPAESGDADLGETAVLLYSWNKAELLGRTLERVAESRLGPALVAVLDNGSDGDQAGAMAAVLARGRERFGERFRPVRLPVNVGAPAARNWLLSLPEVRARRFAAFLDDDVLPPPHWLTRLLAEARSAPGPVGSVGCRIVSAETPAGMQSADYHLLPPTGAPTGPDGRSENVLVFDNVAGGLDQGFFNYTRPAASVSGCCHLLSMEGVERAGAFDIRFAPTQFDDLERDLRLRRAGYAVRYCGDLAVPHVQHSSLAKAQSVLGMAQVFGNKLKLEGLFTAEETRRLAEADLAELWDDLTAKAAAVDERLRG